jgi:hypothetical protein
MRAAGKGGKGGRECGLREGAEGGQASPSNDLPWPPRPASPAGQDSASGPPARLPSTRPYQPGPLNPVSSTRSPPPVSPPTGPLQPVPSARVPSNRSPPPVPPLPVRPLPCPFSPFLLCEAPSGLAPFARPPSLGPVHPVASTRSPPPGPPVPGPRQPGPTCPGTPPARPPWPQGAGESGLAGHAAGGRKGFSCRTAAAGPALGWWPAPSRDGRVPRVCTGRRRDWRPSGGCVAARRAAPPLPGGNAPVLPRKAGRVAVRPGVLGMTGERPP